LTLRIVFGLVASLGILAALGTVLARNLVHAALYLVAFFFTVACLFVLLEAEFLAAIQVLVYIGAVAILLLFGIMLTRNIQGDETTGGHWLRKLPAFIVALAVLGGLIAGIRGQTALIGAFRSDAAASRGPSWTEVARRPSASADDPRTTAINQMAPVVGVELMTRFALAFEVAGLLLTAAVVGAIALAHGERDEPPDRGRRPAARPASVPVAPTNGAGTTNPLAATPSSAPR
jgi:NADH-quinone oxidoreductase subunit J